MKKLEKEIWEYFDSRKKQKKRICLYLLINIFIASAWMPILYTYSHKVICTILGIVLIGSVLGILYILVCFDKNTEKKVIDILSRVQKVSGF